MDITRGYKYRIYPNTAQEHQLLRFFGCCRFVYNHFLEERKRSYEEDGVTMSYTTTSALLTRLKADPEHRWLSECDSMALQEALRDLDRAYQNFFGKRAWYPRFRSRKGSWQSYRTRNQSDGVRILSNAIVLPKLGAVKAKVSRLPKGRILNATVSRTPTGKYFVSLCVEEEVEPKPNNVGMLGIDVGIRSFYTGSDGKSVFSPVPLHACERKLRREQRKLSRRIEANIAGYDSKRRPIWKRPLSECRNIQKQRRRVARIHERIANIRNDFLHQLAQDARDLSHERNAPFCSADV